MVTIRLLNVATFSSRFSHSHRQSFCGISSNSFCTLSNQRDILELRLISYLHGCTDLIHVKKVHAHLFRIGLDQSSFVLAKLLRTLTNFNYPIDSYARQVFDQVHYPNSFLWTAIIRAYSLHGPYYQSIRLYSCMRRLRSRPLSFTFSALLKACGAALDVEVGRQIHAQTILVGGFNSDLFVNNTLIDLYVRCECLNDARKVFDEMPERDVISWTSLIVAYAKREDMNAAEVLFDGLAEKDMVVWTAMITGYAQNARPKEALCLFEKMREEGVETDEVTLVGAISACAQLGVAKYAVSIRDIAEHAGLRPTKNVIVGSALIDMYSKCGSVDEAYQVFEGMTERNIFSYSAMILGFAMHGKAVEAIRLFSEMVSMTSIRPNEVTFIGVLTACSHAGMVDQGWLFFTSMRDNYGITPSADHYTCMVDILGRAGHIEEAYNLIAVMPIKPHAGVWGALLGACRIHGKPHIANIAADHLFELEPDAIGNYVLLSNIYASAGMWDDTLRIRKLMKEKRLRKNPGCSWVESHDGFLHEFFAGDESHPRFHEIIEVLEELLVCLKQVGHLPKLNSVVNNVSEKEKERLLKTHSEKLAFGFGLLTSAAGNAIRIVKNIRMCEDCHSFMCGASFVLERKIVVRDNMRFHHFHGGVCSCNGFW